MKANAALISLGNFTDAFQRLDLSKMSVGFLQEIGTISKQVLVKHLVNRSGHSKSSALRAIKDFGLYLEREFWDMCFASLKTYADTGVKMYILGRGIQTIFPVLAFCVGDDPALHRYCHVFEGNALHSCIYCKYSVKKDGLFNPDMQEVRNEVEIRENALVAFSGARKRNTGVPLLHAEKVALAVLKDQGVYPLPNATTGVPMGFVSLARRNHVFRSPCDILHTLMCGLCKNVVLWVITIVMHVSKSAREVQGASDRANSFPYSYKCTSPSG